MRRLKNILIALDQFLFALLCLGDSYPDETASSAAWRMEQQGRLRGRIFRPVIDWLALLFGDRDHCANSYLSEKNRTHGPS